MHLGIDFWKDFGGFWDGRWRQVGTKIDKKIDLGGVLGGSWWVLGASWAPNPNKPMRNLFFGILLGRSWGRLGGVLGPSWAVLARFWRPRWSQNRKKKIGLTSNQNFDVSRNRFFKDFYWFSNGKWGQVGSKIVSKIDVDFEGKKPTNASRLVFSWLSGVLVGS